MKKQRLLVLVAAGGSLLVCSCAMLQTPIAVAPVGPEPGNQIAQTATGYLKVYTNVEGYPYDEDNFYYVHTDYGIYDLDGKRVKSVQNTESFHSLKPKQVVLPPGHYFVKGWTGANQLAKVPVEIKAGCLTLVNLENNNHELFQKANQDDLVHAPDGRIVGWMASTSAH